MIVAMATRPQESVVMEGRLFNVHRLCWRDAVEREICRDVVRHPGAVLIVPVLDDSNVVMIRNHRVAVAQRLLEFPAGTLERGEVPIRTAARELEEETGYTAANLEPLGRFYTSPGFADELMHVFLAEGLTPVKQRLEAGEDIEVEIMAVPTLMRMAASGELLDGKSLAGLLMWQMRRGNRG